MKRCIHSNSENQRQIIITMTVECAFQEVAATDYIHHPKSISKKRRITDNHLEMLDDIIATFDANIQVAGFDIIDRHQPANSYSYYITFVPVTTEGERLMPIDLIFRVANHLSKSAEGTNASNFVRIIGFTLEHEDFDKASELIYEGIRILRELKKGNIGILDEI